MPDDNRTRCRIRGTQSGTQKPFQSGKNLMNTHLTPHSHSIQVPHGTGAPHVKTVGREWSSARFAAYRSRLASRAARPFAPLICPRSVPRVAPFQKNARIGHCAATSSAPVDFPDMHRKSPRDRRIADSEPITHRVASPFRQSFHRDSSCKTRPLPPSSNHAGAIQHPQSAPV